jgi:signal transduction histidine kinase
LRQVTETRREKRFDGVVSQAPNQPDRYFNVVCNPLRGPAGAEAAGGLLLIEDVSPTITMEHRLAVSERLAAVGKLASKVAHELNNPLDGILRYTNLAIRKAAEHEDPKIMEYLDHARSGIVRMSHIISSLLEFSRSTGNTFEQATINKIAEDAIAAIAGRAQEAGVSVVCNFEQDMPVVRGSNLFQVFCNLMKNAVDAMPDGGTLSVTTKIVGPDVIVLIEDSGIGLPPEADRIFEPFFTTKPLGKGTGLGLAVCREIIEKYSGSITAERREPKGTRLTVRIPTRNCAAIPVGVPFGNGGRIQRVPNAVK